MKVAISVEFGLDDQLIFAQQLGVNHVLVRTNQTWNIELIEKIKNRVAQCGLVLAGLEGFDPRNEDARNFVTSAGKAGVPLISTFLSDCDQAIQEPTGRGKALVSSIAKEIHTEPNESLVQLAEKNNVNIAWTYPYSGNKYSGGIDLQIGELNETQENHLARINAPIYIARVGNRLGKTRSFLDDGDISIPRSLRSLGSLGFSGYVATTPPPGMIDDTDWRHKGRSHDVGYLKAIIQTLESS
ncbi:MAG: hypothetical protein VX294_12170 [Candidatus Latescibacterota bacterium]|nr:hypothetical protein [Candidatus Latescibacterota bacterium]